MFEPVHCYSTITADGALLLPEEVRLALDLHAGSEVELRIGAAHVVMRRKPKDAIEEVRGTFAGEPPLEDDLNELRKAEE